MFKAKPIPKDYQPPTGGLSSFDDGDLEVKGIKWVHLDANKKPALKVQKDGKLTGRLRFVLDENKVGPYFTIEVKDMNMLLMAFDRNAKLQIPPKEEDAKAVSEFMQYVEQSINNSGNTTVVTVKDGFVAYVRGMQVKANCRYYLRLIWVVSKDENGEPSFKRNYWPKGGYTDYIHILIEIHSGDFGQPSPFDNCVFKTKTPYGFEVNNKGDIVWTTKDGKQDSAATQASSFYNLTAPEMFTTQVQPESQDMVKFWLNFADIPSAIFAANVEENISNNGVIFYNIDWTKATLVPNQVLDTNDIPQDFFETEKETQIYESREPLSDDEMDSRARGILVDMLSFLAGGMLVFDNDFQLNDTGKMIADKYLTPLVKAGKVQLMKIADMNHANVMELANVLFESLSVEQKQQTALYVQAIEELLIGKVDDVEFDSGETSW